MNFRPAASAGARHNEWITAGALNRPPISGTPARQLGRTKSTVSGVGVSRAAIVPVGNKAAIEARSKVRRSIVIGEQCIATGGSSSEGLVRRRLDSNSRKKCVAVFRPELCKNKALERLGDPIKH
ncbi:MULTISPECIES: hypothetical protein [Mesorhizobium]|uniref:hypothetical protein n=1 Tax=Mesorhizobium australicum TaxID=536018 RepID=UPI003336981A